MNGLSLEEMTVDEACTALAPHLDRFRGAVSRWSPLHEPSNLRLWERILGRRNRCRIVVAWDPRGDLAAYAPLMRVPGRVGPVPVPTLRFIGNNVGYPGDILYGDVYATKAEPSPVREVLRHVASTWSLGKWELGYVSPSSPTWAAAAEILGNGFVVPGPRGRVPFVTVHLPSRWDAFLASLTANTRSSYRRGLRHLEGLGHVRLVVDTTREGVRRRVEELLANHTRWLEGTEKEHWFGDRAVRRFLMSSSELLAGRGWFLASALELDGAPLAWVAGPAYGRACFEQICSYDRTYSTGSPGLVLGVELMRELIARGIRRVDLGPGATLYKRRLGGIPEPYLRVLGYQGWVHRAASAHRILRRNRSTKGPRPDVLAADDRQRESTRSPSDRGSRPGGAETSRRVTPDVAPIASGRRS